MSQPSRLRPERTPTFKSMQVFRKRLVAAGHVEPTSPKHMKRIAVIGSQSAGKSALVSMLTGIKLESSIKATTRGPTVFRFIKGEEQGGYRVWPEFVEDAEGTSFASPIRGDEEVCRKADVPAKIKDLHRLVLRPEFDEFGDYIDSQDISSEQRLADIDSTFFTENRVVVEKIDPNMPDVEIIDLPGLQVSSQHPHVLEKIRKITQENLRVPNTFAVGVCPATTEPESQDVLNIVRAWDPNFSRTLIALSRSDELSGNECAWEEMISTHPGTFCFIISLPPSGVAATLEELEHEEKSCFDNMLKSNKSFVHKVPKTILGIQSLRKLILAKMLGTERVELLDVLEGLRSKVSALTARQDEFRQLDVIGKINSSIDLAADRICKAITEFERFPGTVRDRLCDQLASALSKDQPDEADIIRPEVTVGRYAVSEMDETITRIQKDWGKEVESHQAKVWNGLIQHVEASLPAITPHGLLRKIRLAIISVIEEKRAASKTLMDHMTMQYTGPLDILTCDADADARYRQAYIPTAAPFQSSSSPMMTPPRPTSPLTPPSSLKRKRSSDDPRILLKEDIALDLARKIKIHVEIARERLLRVTQDHLSHSLASLANVGVAHLLRDKIGTNRILTLEAAASIMAQSAEEAEKNQNMVAELERLIDIGSQARIEG